MDTRQVENLRQSALDGDFTWLPDIQWMDANKLPNSNLGLSSMRGAYSSENDTVYLSRQLLSEDPTHSARVLTEEIGQAIGQRINNAETPRVQGELFSTLLYGDKLTLARIQALKPEHINNAVEFENQQSQVKGNIFSSAFDIIKSEFDRLVDKVKGAFKKLGKYLNDAQDYVTDLLENTVGVIKDAGDLLGNTINAFSEVTQDVVNALAEGTSDLVESAIKSLINTGKKFAKNIKNALKKLANGDIPGAIANLAKASAQLLLLGPAELAIEGGKQVLDTGIRLLHAAFDLIDNLTGAPKPRQLSEEEIDYLKPIFGDTLDYNAIKIKRGGSTDVLGMDAHVIANTIYMPSDFFNGKTLNEKGLRTFGHEAAHIWQYQRYGDDYIHEALHAQTSGDGYDLGKALSEGKGFREMNPEQQAVVAELIGASINNSTDGLLVLNDFNDVASDKKNHGMPKGITMAQFEIILEAHTNLQTEWVTVEIQHKPVALGGK